jgi:hypothetical protein
VQGVVTQLYGEGVDAGIMVAKRQDGRGIHIYLTGLTIDSFEADRDIVAEVAYHVALESGAFHECPEAVFKAFDTSLCGPGKGIRPPYVWKKVDDNPENLLMYVPVVHGVELTDVNTPEAKEAWLKMTVRCESEEGVIKGKPASDEAITFLGRYSARAAAAVNPKRVNAVTGGVWSRVEGELAKDLKHDLSSTGEWQQRRHATSVEYRVVDGVDVCWSRKMLGVDYVHRRGGGGRCRLYILSDGSWKTRCYSGSFESAYGKEWRDVPGKGPTPSQLSPNTSDRIRRLVVELEEARGVADIVVAPPEQQQIVVAHKEEEEEPLDEQQDGDIDIWTDTTMQSREGPFQSPPLGRGLCHVEMPFAQFQWTMQRLFRENRGVEMAALFRKFVTIVYKPGPAQVFVKRTVDRPGETKVVRLEQYSISETNDLPKWFQDMVDNMKDIWNKSRSMHTYGHVAYDVYNTFIGLHVEREHDITDYDYDVTKFDLWLDTLKAQCEDNEEYFEYALDFYADIVQNPGKRPSHGLFFVGTYGTGKTSTAESFGTYVLGTSDPGAYGGHGVYDPLFTMFPSIDDVMRKFNGAAGGKLLILLDDQSQENKSKSDEGGFNNLMSRRFTKVERKGKEVEDVPEFSRIIACSNFPESWRLRIGQRRILLFRSSTRLVNKRGRWVDYYKQVEAPEFAPNLYKYLMSRDIRGFNRNPGKLPFTTEIMQERMEASAPVEIRYLAERFLPRADEPGTHFMHCLATDCTDVKHDLKDCTRKYFRARLSKEGPSIIPHVMIKADFKAWAASNETQKFKAKWNDTSFPRTWAGLGIINTEKQLRPTEFVRKNCYNFASLDSIKQILITNGYLCDESGEEEEA